MYRPWTIRIGIRFTSEPDVWFKVVSDSASVTVGDYTFVGRGTELDIAECITIGSHVLIAPECFLADHNHGIAVTKRIDQQPCKAAPIVIEDDVWLGTHVIVLPGVRIGAGAVVGAGACVTQSVSPRTIVAGVPARPVGVRQ
jgi:galactoside O-acetyltransferase